MDWYVKRINGKIVTAAPGFVAGMAEEGPIDENDPELQAFLHPPPPPPGPYLLRMSDFWNRFVDDTEYDAFLAVFDVALPSKSRRALNSATELLSNSDLFVWAKALLVTATSATRADEIMAPSPTLAGKSTDEEIAEI